MSLGLWVVLCKKLLVYFPIFLLANESLRGFLDKYAKWSFAVWFLVLIGQGHRNVQERGTHFWQMYLIQRLVTIVVQIQGGTLLSNIKRSVSYVQSILIQKEYISQGGFICTFSLLISLSFTFQSSKFNYISGSKCCLTRTDISNESVQLSFHYLKRGPGDASCFQ